MDMKKYIVLALVLAACGTPTVVSEPAGSDEPAPPPTVGSTTTMSADQAASLSTTTSTTTSPEDTVTPKPPPDSVPPPSEIQPTGGEVPAAYLAAVLADAAERLEVDQSELSVDEAVAVVWSDGSLGCPEPGQDYIQVLIEGYRVVVSAYGETLDYRLDQRGHFRLCESGMPRLEQP